MLAGCSDKLLQEAQDAVAAKSLDPASVQFKDVARCSQPNMVSGEMNAKNLYGAYTGFKMFYYDSSSHEVAINTGEDDSLPRLMRHCFGNEITRKVRAEVGH